MSRENVEPARIAYDACNRGDMDAMPATFDADFELVK
jgi:hypothetical protein